MQENEMVNDLCHMYNIVIKSTVTFISSPSNLIDLSPCLILLKCYNAQSIKSGSSLFGTPLKLIA